MFSMVQYYNYLSTALRDYFASDIHMHNRTKDDYPAYTARTYSRLFSIKCSGPIA